MTAPGRTWMPLYVGDYLSDTGHLTIEQSGAYLHLLMYSWRTDRLPADSAALAQLCRVSPTRWRRDIGPAVLPFFADEGGILRNARLENERAKAAKNSNRQREKSVTRWSKNLQPETPKNKGLGSAAAFPRESPSPSPIESKKESSTPSPRTNHVRSPQNAAPPGAGLFGMPSDAEMQALEVSGPPAAPSRATSSARESAPTLTNGIAIAFEQFWAAYPHRLSGDRLVKPDRGGAERAFARAVKKMPPAEIVAAVGRYPFDRNRPQFIQGPAVWLNAENFRADISANRHAPAPEGKMAWMIPQLQEMGMYPGFGDDGADDHPGMTIDAETQA